MVAKGKTRSIEDAGEKIGGARKDFSRTALNADELAGMTDAEMADRVRKDNVWPKPDFAAMAESGADPAALAAVKIIRDRIARVPSVSTRRDHSETLAWYAETLAAARDDLLACKTMEDVAGAYDRVAETVGLRSSDPGFFRAEGGARLAVISRGRFNPLYLSGPDRRKARKMVEDGFPEPPPPFLRGRSVSQRRSNGQWYVTKGRYVVSPDFASREDALEWAKEEYEARKSDPSAQRGKSPSRPHLDNLEREGLPDWREGREVSPDDFIETFGFRGVEFGEWLPDDERQTVLNLGYDSFMDLARCLGMEPGQISLGGRLAVAFGARGQGGFAAHYEADREVINLTRLSGAGSLAHEYGHALDHLMAHGSEARMAVRSLSGWRSPHSRCDEALAHRGAPVVEAGNEVLSAIYKRPQTRAERIAYLENRIETVEGYARNWRKAADAESERVRQGGRYSRVTARKLANGLRTCLASLDDLRAALAAVGRSPEDATFAPVASNFFSEAVAISGKSGYWARPTELFARAFESFVEDRIEAEGGRSPYLVSFTKPEFYPPEIFKGNPYPAESERERLSGAFDRLVAAYVPLVRNMAADRPLPIRAPR